MSWSKEEFGFETRAIHAGQEPDATTGAIMTPIYMSSTYVQESPGKHKGYVYARGHNLTRKSYETCVANLEGAEFGFAFSSGCAAMTTAMHLLKSGDHVVACDDMYGGTFRLFDKVIQNNGIEFSYVDLLDPNNLEKAITDKTKMVWIETPTNPLLRLFDIKKICEIAHAKNLIVAVDNTFMSPYLQNPIALGADIVVHSSTKFINGHSDIIGGVAVTDKPDLAEKLAFLSNSMGGVQSPFDSFMCMRSLKTLAVRMEAHQKNARAIAKFLEEHPKVDRVMYPGLESHPQYALANEQMKGPGGMITFYTKGGLSEARTFLESVKVFSLAESLGGVESLVEHPAIMTHASVPAETRAELGIDDSLIRLSVGIETQDDLLKDLDQALAKI